MRIGITIKLLVCAFIAYDASFVLAQNCPVGEIEDCNGYCAPMEWLMDATCDDEVREYPAGSGYYVDFSCEDFMCDLFACEGCGDDCPPGLVPDCNGNCIPPSYIQDGICDMGQRFYKGVPVDFSCRFFGCDMGDCAGSCWDDLGMEGLEDIGACCLGTECSEITRGECWTLGYIFIGNNTMCLPETCSCGDPSDGLDWIVDCNGECVLLWNVGGGYCSHGETVDYGDGSFEIDLDCPELACGLSGCVGNCLGGCCTDADCITVTYYDCIEIGGLFLGSYVDCDETGCASEQQPIQLPDTELYWSGKLGEVENFPQWIISEEDLLIAGAMDNSTFEWKTAICVFRYNETEDEWEEEALLVPPDGKSGGYHASYTTDGHRIAVTSEMAIDKKLGIYRKVIDIFAFDGSDWLHEQTIDDSESTNEDNYQWGDSLDILGDVLVVGDPMYNQQPNTDTNYGAAHVYHYDVTTGWAFDSILAPWGDPPFPDGDDPYLGLSVALSDSVVAVESHQSILLYDISGESPVPLQHIRDIEGNFHPRHRSLDFDNDRLMTHVTRHEVGGSEIYGSQIFEFDGAEWSATATLVPFDIAGGTDYAGYIVDLQGDRAMITSPHDNDLGHKTGSAYIWEYDGSDEWIFKSKLWSDRATGYDEFGIGGALHGSNAYLTGIVEEPQGDGIKVFFPRGIAWINPLGGLLSDSANWDPQIPTSSDSVKFSLRAEFVVQINQEIPFNHMFIGPGTPIFGLGGVDRSMGASGEAINLQGVPGLEARLEISQGILTVDGEVHVGEEDLPATISIQGNLDGLLGGLHVNGYWLQHEKGTLDLQLATGRPAPLQITGTAPKLRGVLSLNLDEDYTPVDGDIIPLVTTEFVDDDTGVFSIFMVNDPLPEGLYLKVNYSDPAIRGVHSASAEIDELGNLFGYGDENSTTITGLATDIKVIDIMGTDRVADGFDDIIVTTADYIYVFVSDGLGGIDTQYSINFPGATLNAVDVGDLDGDGDLDIVVVNTSVDQFIPIYHDPSLPEKFSIGTPEDTGPVPVDVLLMNIDGDLDKDVIVACQGNSNTDGVIDFFESQQGLRSFSNAGTVGADGGPGGVNPGDVNNDKDLSLNVLLKTANGVGKVRNSGALNGTFNWVLESVTNVAIGPSKIVTGDLNNDSIPDVVVSCPDSDVICILKGTTEGSFSVPLQLNVGIQPDSIAILDFNNDGDNDIAVIAVNGMTGNRAIFLYRNDTTLNGGNLMFANDSMLDDGLNPILVAGGDIDGMLGDDLVSVNGGSSFRGANGDLFLRRPQDQGGCTGDLDGNNQVNVDDLLLLISAWGQTSGVPADLDGNGIVGVDDLLLLIAAWGPCP